MFFEDICRILLQQLAESLDLSHPRFHNHDVLEIGDHLREEECCQSILLSCAGTQSHLQDAYRTKSSLFNVEMASYLELFLLWALSSRDLFFDFDASL